MAGEESDVFQNCANHQNQISHLEAYWHEVMENLTTKEGIGLWKQRGVDVESVFCHIKHNMGYRHYLTFN